MSPSTMGTSIGQRSKYRPRPKIRLGSWLSGLRQVSTRTSGMIRTTRKPRRMALLWGLTTIIGPTRTQVCSSRILRPHFTLRRVIFYQWLTSRWLPQSSQWNHWKMGWETSYPFVKRNMVLSQWFTQSSRCGRISFKTISLIVCSGLLHTAPKDERILLSRVRRFTSLQEESGIFLEFLKSV